MNPAYSQVRFRYAPPSSGIPPSFGIVTAWNPDGELAEEAANDAANARLAAELCQRGLPFFPVTGGSPDFLHAEPSYGIFAEQETILNLGRTYKQEAVFWVN